MIETLKREWPAKIAVVFFVILTIWWVVNNYIIGNELIKYNTFFDFGEFYGYMAILGAVCGISIAMKWGGLKSVMGRALFLFSAGLLAQEFGQLFYAWYNNIYDVPGPYPSIGDIGYFGSIFLYGYGVVLLGKASGVKIRLKSIANTLQAVFIPLGMLAVGYFLFLNGYEFDWSDPLKIFLDFGYPLGQAIYVSMAFLTYLLSRGVLGGIMKSKILFILFALVLQFFADYTFLYQSNRGMYEVGGNSDYLYFVSYFVMTLALIQFMTVLKGLKHE